MRISAKADYAVRAAVELAGVSDEKPVKAERIAPLEDNVLLSGVWEVVDEIVPSS